MAFALNGRARLLLNPPEGRPLTTRQASLDAADRLVASPTGLLTLGFDPTRFQTEPPACYRASWQLPGPDSHRQATTSLCQNRYTISTSNSGRTPPTAEPRESIVRECTAPRWNRPSTLALRSWRAPDRRPRGGVRRALIPRKRHVACRRHRLCTMRASTRTVSARARAPSQCSSATGRRGGGARTREGARHSGKRHLHRPRRSRAGGAGRSRRTASAWSPCARHGGNRHGGDGREASSRRVQRQRHPRPRGARA